MSKISSCFKDFSYGKQSYGRPFLWMAFFYPATMFLFTTTRYWRQVSK